MADIIKGLFGSKPSTTAISDDFADYATAASAAGASYATPSFLGSGSASSDVPYTAWYRIWERTSLSDFKAELYIIPVVIVIFLQLLWGRSVNRRKAKAWMTAAAPILEKEFASVGFDGIAKSGSLDVASLIKEKTATEFVSYATGRQNVAFVDIKVNLLRRFNPLVLTLEYIASIVSGLISPPKENIEIVLYTFDGHEKTLVPSPTAIEGEEAQARSKVTPSNYDGFVWAIVHKDSMKAFRSDRFDVSLTDIKDHPKLPNWATVMSESAEITDTLLTADLVKAIEMAGYDNFEYLLVTDLPADRPKTVDDLEPRKRLFLALKIPSGSYDSVLPLFSHFIRFPDELVSKARFRAEVQRKLKKTRDEEANRVKKAGEDERAEERKLGADKRKKQEREDLLRTMSPAEQRKFLDKERDKQNRKSMRRTRA